MTPVDYKRGAAAQRRPRRRAGGLGRRPRAVGRAGAGAARQRLSLRRGDRLLRGHEAARARADRRADGRVDAGQVAAGPRDGRSRHIPPPLVDSPKCPRCSLVGICLPDETTALQLHQPAAKARSANALRRGLTRPKPDRPVEVTSGKCGGCCLPATICGRCI